MSAGTGFAALTRAQGKGFVRDRQMLFWTIAFPLMFLVVFGLIFGSSSGASRIKVAQVGAVALFDQLPGQARGQLDEVVEITRMDDRAGALEQVRKGELGAAVEMTGTVVILHYSQADQVRAATVQGVMSQLVQGANLAVSGTPATFSLDAQRVEDKALKAIQFLAPGLLAWAVAMSGVFGAALVLVQWRQSKLLRRLRLSPIRTSTLVSSRTLITLAVALLQMAIFLAVGILFFGLQLSGSWWLGVPILLAGALAFQSIGLLTGALSKTPEGASGLANLIIMPMAFLGGSFFPLDQMPEWMARLARFLPLGHLNEGISAVMVRGQGVEAIWQPITVLLGFAVVVGLLAARLFRWEAD